MVRATHNMSSSEANTGGGFGVVSRYATGSRFDGVVMEHSPTIARAYRMRAYPNKAQQRMLSRLSGATRFVWNWALDLRSAAYRADGTKLNWIALSRAFTQLRAAPETAWLSDLPREPFNQVLRDQERAFVNFFAKRAKYPRFRRRGAPTGMRFTIDQRREQVSRAQGERYASADLPALGELKLRRTEELTGRLRSVTLRCEAGCWYACITADGIDAPASAPAARAILGVDVGIKDLLVRSDGVRVSAPAALRQHQARLRRYQRHYVRQRDAAARRQGLDPGKPFPKGTRLTPSNRMFGTKHTIARLHARVAAIRREVLHQATTAIVRSAQVIAIEDLNVKAIARGMGRHAFRRAAHNVALGELRRQLEYKAQWAKRTVHLVDRFYPSSKTCSACGTINKTLALKDRRWACATCSTEHDRDVNAAQNLEAHARRALEPSPLEEPRTRRQAQSAEPFSAPVWNRQGEWGVRLRENLCNLAADGRPSPAQCAEPFSAPVWNRQGEWGVRLRQSVNKESMMRTFAILLLMAACAMLSACGGGTVSASGQQTAGNTTQTTYSMTVNLADAAGTPGFSFSAGGTVQVKATVTQSVKTTDSTGGTSVKNSPAQGVIVVFASAAGTFTPAAGNTLTDANGIASIVLTLGQVSGAFAVNATAQGSGVSATATANLLIATAATPTISVLLLDGSGSPINRIQAGAIGSVHVSAKQLNQEVGQTGGTMTPAANIPITVSTDGGTLDPSTGSVLTDANGNASLTFQASATQGAYTLSASATIQGSTTTATSNFAVEAPLLVLGSGTPFQAGVVQVSPATVQGGATATATVLLTDGAGHPFALPVSVVFTSTCADAGKATLTSPVPAVNGVASAAYTPGNGCLGQDQIKAQVTLPGQSIPTTASGTATVVTPPATGILFDSATPASIALAGRGTSARPERSTVVFTVVSANGVAVPGQAVNFSLSSLAGGVRLASSGGISDNNGHVQTVVQSGSIPSTVTVSATLPGATGSAVSTGIVISSGAAEQSGFSLSATQLNIEAWNIDGVTDQLTIRAADHYSNPVPDGTTVSFTADGGSISPSCTIAGGACTVTLTSQNPRPANGRVVILAATPGDETFTDLNGNGLWDPGEPFQALAEPWRDDNENGKYDVGEFYIDANRNGRWDAASTVYAGSLCNPTAVPKCDPNGTYVREQMVVVFATSATRIQVSPATIALGAVNPVNVRISISDGNGNLPPANSSVQITTSAGKLLSAASYTIGDSNARGPLVLNAQMLGDGSSTSGVLTVTVTTPKGAITTSQTTITQTAQQTVPGSLVLTPSTFSVPSNQTTTLQTQAVVNTSAPAQPLAGVTPVVNCVTGTSTGLTLTPPTSVAPTGTSGSTVIAIGAVTAAAASGTATCTVTAGTVNATLTINAGP